MSISTSHHSKFPVELYDLIIDELAASSSRPIYSNSSPALQVCLFVSRSFRHRACHHLFSGIRIDQDDAPLSDEYIDPSVELDMTPQMIHDQLKLLVDIMQPAGFTQDSPCAYGIRPYIRDIYFGLHAAGVFDTDSDLANSEIARQSRVYALSILEMLRNPPSVSGGRPLRSFVMCGRGSEIEPEWFSVPSTVRSSLLDLLQCSQDLSLTVNWLTFLPKNFLCGTTVRSLDYRDGGIYALHPGTSLTVEEFPEYDEEGGLALLPLPRLDSATIRDAVCLNLFCEDIYPRDPTGQTQRTLNKLAVELLRFQDWGNLDQIAKEFPDLKTLAIFHEGFSRPHEHTTDPNNLSRNPFDIRGLRSLQRIEVSLNCQFKHQIRSPDMWSPDRNLDPQSGSVCPALYALLVVMPPMFCILRSCANDSVSELWLSFCELSIKQQWNPAGNASYDLDVRVFWPLDFLLSSGSSNDSVSTSTRTSASNLFPSLRRCIIEMGVYREAILHESMDHADDLEQTKLVLEAERKKLEDFIRRGFPCLGARSSRIAFDLRITFRHHFARSNDSGE